MDLDRGCQFRVPCIYDTGRSSHIPSHMHQPHGTLPGSVLLMSQNLMMSHYDQAPDHGSMNDGSGREIRSASCEKPYFLSLLQRIYVGLTVCASSASCSTARS